MHIDNMYNLTGSLQKEARYNPNSQQFEETLDKENTWINDLIL